jgi:2,4-dienoyl-CoA reductase-like NADH-dependent reductase (Old Yellow Enzyme family)
MRENLDFLFKPTVWRGQTIPSRILLAPINTGFARSYRPQLPLLRFHRERSGPTIGICTVGNVAITPHSAAGPATVVLSDVSGVPRLAAVARAIRERGSVPGIQLASSPIGLAPATRWRTPDVDGELARLRKLITSLDRLYLREILGQFIVSARHAQEAGFEFIQIHAAHGYLLSLLLMSAVNGRDDEFSCDGKWLDGFIMNLRNVCRDALLSVRISIQSGINPSGNDEDNAVAHRLATNGVDLIDLSSGLYTIDRHLIYPSIHSNGLPLYPAARRLSAGLPAMVAFAGNILDLRDTPDDLPDNVFLTVGRALIADPDFAMKSSLRRFSDITWCRRIGHCHYFTRGRSHLECGVNAYVQVGGRRQENYGGE